MQNTVSLLLVALLTAGCTGNAARPLAVKKASRILIAEADSVQYLLAGYHDPYQDMHPELGVTPDSLIPDTLTFFADGHFLRSASGVHTTGDWRINRARQAMMLRTTMTDTLPVAPRQQDTIYRYNLIRTGDTLRWGVQGRHGIVTYTWHKTASPQP
ncbi:MAG: hypothetical protein SF053_21300 [Bacteroidia bacterium]|nr:hypothetical protein [Bacteroidia bacterium]